MKSIYRHTLFVLAIAAMPTVAAAEDAFTLQTTDIFAGPSSEFPQVAQLPPNTEVGVAGCLSDWSWCDVRFANDRGWVWAGDLGYPYQNGRVAIIEYGPRLRLPLVTFSLNTYWDAHYRSRPFFRERNVWVSRVHVEGSHGGRPPHGGTRVALSSKGAQPGPEASARGAQPQSPPQHAQGAQRPREEAAQRESSQQRSHEQAAQRRPTEQHAQGMQQPQREEAAQRNQAEQRTQAKQQRPHEEAAQRPQPEASRAHNEQRAQAAPQAQGSRGMAQEQPPQREARETTQSAHQPEAARGAESDRRNAKQSQGKEERKEGNQQ